MKDENYYRWICPICGVEQYDPLSVKLTECRNGHPVKLLDKLIEIPGNKINNFMGLSVSRTVREVKAYNVGGRYE